MKLLPANNSNKGFTLLELLVVIGVLGILAAGLLATIDPLEQFRKGQDSNRQQAAVEYMNALTRYYAANETYPWLAAPGGTAACSETVANNGTTVLKDVDACTTKALVDQGELKSTFQKATAMLTELHISATTTDPRDSKISVCFKPQSKSAAATAKYNVDGAYNASCVAGSCYWCAQ